MTAPTYQSTTVTDFGSDATTHAANMPATANAGDLLIALAAFDFGAGTSLATPNGWTELIGDPGAISMVWGIYGKRADGTEGGGTVDFATSDAQRGSVHVLRVTGWSGDLNEIPGMVTQSPGSPTNLQVSLNAGESRDILWIAAQFKTTTGTWAAGNGTPANYSNDNRTGTGEDTTASASIASATRTTTASVERLTLLWRTASADVVALLAVLPVGAIQSVRPQSIIGV